MTVNFNKRHQALSTEKILGDLWHARLGHLNERSIRNLVNKSIIPSNIVCKDISKCHPCMIQKSHNLPRKKSFTFSTPLRIIFSNIWGLGVISRKSK